MSPNSNAKTKAAAKEYVDEQLATMRQFGSAPNNLSDEEYQSLITQISEVINLK